MADGSDELYTLRNAYFLGNFSEALAEAETIARPKSEALRLELDVLRFRAHVGLGNYACVAGQRVGGRGTSEIASSGGRGSPPPLTPPSPPPHAAR